MKTMPLVLALLTSSTGIATGCDAEPEDTLVELDADTVSLRNGASEAFIEAKMAIDESVATVQQADAFEWPVLRDRLVELADYVDYDALTPAERDALDIYSAEAAAGVQPQLELLSAMVSLPETDEPDVGVCYTRCHGIVERACENNAFLGFCGGVWGCDDGNGGHPCREDDDHSNPALGPCKADPCISGLRCAWWALRPDQCVQECDDDGDCPLGQQCEQPFGTGFHRCL